MATTAPSVFHPRGDRAHAVRGILPLDSIGSSFNPSPNQESPPGPIHLQPPPPIALPKISRINEVFRVIKIFLGGTVTDRPSCTRAPLTIETYRVIHFGQFSMEQKTVRSNDGFEDHRYIVIGIIGAESSEPKEVFRPIVKHTRLFQQIRTANSLLRGPVRRMLSLKRVVGFGIYECHCYEGSHRPVDVDDITKRTLAEMFRDYQTRRHDYGDRWMTWIHNHFNISSKDPERGKYSLQLILGWSVPKLVFWGVAPILLSLAVGFWYMYSAHPDADPVAVVQTAWTISSYIVTAAALAIGILAAITQLGDV